ncbi:MAG TPA: glycosyltransferase [Dermatophilaceae bacterium]|nr:glycosyltransferase [Dermatophilaceae bacterium]
MRGPSRRDDRPHLLLIAVFFPPSRASGVFRPLAMANFFVTHGWQVSVITVTEDFFDRVTGSRDDSLGAAIHPHVEVIRVPMPIAHLERDIRRFTPMRANFPRLHSKLFASLSVFDRYTPWLPRVLAAALRLHRRAPIDLVLATGNPWTSFAAAAVIHELTRVPYVVDYRDSWTLNQFTQQLAFPAGDRAYTWEPRLLRRAAAVVTVNEPMRRWYARRYPDIAARTLVLENGYDAGLLSEDRYRPPAPGAPLRFGYLGTLTTQYDNRAFWAGWQLALADPSMAGATTSIYGHVGFFAHSGSGPPNPALPGPTVPAAHYLGPVVKADVAATYRDLDVLLFWVPSSPFVTSGKTYEYMSTGKPIVAVHTPDSAAGDPLRGYPLKASVAAMTPEAIRDALIEAARLARTSTRADHEAALAHARRFDRRALLAPFEARMRALARRHVEVAG